MHNDEITNQMFLSPIVNLVQIAREMVISPRNSRLGLATLVKRAGMMDRPDSPDSELIKYKVFFISLLRSWYTIKWHSFLLINFFSF